MSSPRGDIFYSHALLPYLKHISLSLSSPVLPSSTLTRRLLLCIYCCRYHSAYFRFLFLIHIKDALISVITCYASVCSSGVWCLGARRHLAGSFRIKSCGLGTKTYMGELKANWYTHIHERRGQSPLLRLLLRVFFSSSSYICVCSLSKPDWFFFFFYKLSFPLFRPFPPFSFLFVLYLIFKPFFGLESGSSESVFSFLVSRFFTEKMQDKYVQLALVVVTTVVVVLQISSILRSNRSSRIIRPKTIKSQITETNN